QSRALAARFCFYGHNHPPLAPPPIPPHHHLQPREPRPPSAPLSPNQHPPLSIRQSRSPVARFCFFGHNQPPLVHHPITPHHHLNHSVPRPNRVPSTRKKAPPHF